MKETRAKPQTGTTDSKAGDAQAAGKRIVSSLHLVSDKSPELSEFEFGMIIANNAFSRWMVRYMSAAGVKDMAPSTSWCATSQHRGMESGSRISASFSTSRIPTSSATR